MAEAQEVAFGLRVHRVTEVGNYIKLMIARNSQLRDIAVRGEVTNISRSNGVLYFALKDGERVLNAVAFTPDFAAFPPFENGTEIVVRGEMQTYDLRRNSLYQIRVREATLYGIGAERIEFEKLKKKLAEDGVFRLDRKRPIPMYPFRIALVSSRRASGAGDILKLLAKRAPHIRVEFCETSVQGIYASIEIAQAIDDASRLDVDAIVVARGGGSFEDLLPFSAEPVVRAVVRARHPVISAVGHHHDQQLCDLAADKHFETPSDAAHSLGYDTADLIARYTAATVQTRRQVERRIRSGAERLKREWDRPVLSRPERLIEERRQELDDIARTTRDRALRVLRRKSERLEVSRRRLELRDPTQRLGAWASQLDVLQYRIEKARAGRVPQFAARLAALEARLPGGVAVSAQRKRQRLRIAEVRLEGLDPTAILQRGYAIVEHAGRIVRDPADVAAGERITARVARGTIAARVEVSEVNGN